MKKEEDLINKVIESHYNLFKNYDLKKIKEYFGKDNKIHLDDEVIRRRIEKIKNESNRIPKNKDKNN